MRNSLRRFVGKKIGLLKVRDFEMFPQKVGTKTIFHCDCDCGNSVSVYGSNLARGLVRSCGCLRTKVSGDRLRTHGMSGTRFHKIWKGMGYRCRHDVDYAGRGITVSPRWMVFRNFMEDMLTSYEEHVRVHGVRETSIERKDNDSGYSPENCVWATQKVQQNNRRPRKSNNMK